MHIGLHLLKKSVKLIFPKATVFKHLISEIKLFSPEGRGNCGDTKNILNFTLLIAEDNYIRGEIFKGVKVKARLFEKCGEDPENLYDFPSIDDHPADLEDVDSRDCDSAALQIYDKDITRHFMELQISGNFECQVFMEIPSYMELENIELPEFETNKLNESFVGHEEGYWWKRVNDEMLPDQISFDSEKNVKINILNSTVLIPYFFRISIEQPIPTFKFNFGAKCVGAVFEMYLNLKNDCQILIKLDENGFTFSTPLRDCLPENLKISHMSGPHNFIFQIFFYFLVEPGLKTLF